MTDRPANCARCGAAIRWGLLVASQTVIPFHAHHNGDLLLVEREGEVPHLVAPPDRFRTSRRNDLSKFRRVAPGPRFVSHFAVCPAASHFLAAPKDQAHGH